MFDLGASKTWAFTSGLSPSFAWHSPASKTTASSLEHYTLRTIPSFSANNSDALSNMRYGSTNPIHATIPPTTYTLTTSFIPFICSHDSGFLNRSRISIFVCAKGAKYAPTISPTRRFKLTQTLLHKERIILPYHNGPSPASKKGPSLHLASHPTNEISPR